jgi:LAS superfamily LD-carboxypeptidase LdcB
MRRSLLAFYCAAIVALSSCTVPFFDIPLEYGAAPARERPAENIYMQNAPNPVALRTEQSPSPQPVPAPDISRSLEQANESLDGDETVINDFSVSPDGAELEDYSSEFMIFPNYVKNNDARYQAFTAFFPDLPVQSSLALVNVNADFGFYNGILYVEDPGCILVLCNKNFKLPTGFAPESLRSVAGTQHKMIGEAAAAFELMQEALQEELGLSLVVVSAYRDYHYQEALYKRYAAKDGAAVADTYSARAGHSEHQTGLAIDFLHRWPSGSLRGAGFQNTVQYVWLQAHAHKFGFILRYPEGYESFTGYRFEPWHWRYIGSEDATRMHQAGITTFEEYIGTYYS